MATRFLKGSEKELKKELEVEIKKILNKYTSKIIDLTTEYIKAKLKDHFTDDDKEDVEIVINEAYLMEIPKGSKENGKT